MISDSPLDSRPEEVRAFTCLRMRWNENLKRFRWLFRLLLLLFSFIIKTHIIQYYLFQMIIVIIALIVHFAQFVHNSCKQTQVVLQHSLKALRGMMRWFLLFSIFDFSFVHFQFQIQFQFHLIAIVLLPLFCYLFVFLLEWEDTTGNKKEARVTMPMEARSKMTRNNFWPEIIYLVFVLFVRSRLSSARLYVLSIWLYT